MKVRVMSFRTLINILTKSMFCNLSSTLQIEISLTLSRIRNPYSVIGHILDVSKMIDCYQSRSDTLHLSFTPTKHLLTDAVICSIVVGLVNI